MHVVGGVRSMATMQLFLLLSLSRRCRSFAPKRMLWTRGSSSLQRRIDVRGEPCVPTEFGSDTKIGRGSTRIFSSSTSANAVVAPTACSGEDAQKVLSTEIELSLTDGMVVRGQRWAHYKFLQNENTTTTTTTTTTQAVVENDGDGHEHEQSTPLRSKTRRILALHGWLDNCRSFHYIAPRLVENLGAQAELVAIDLPGHGWSSHRPMDGPTTILSEGAYYIAEVLDALGWGEFATAKDDTKNEDDGDDDNDDDNDNDNKVILVGHSMGGGMAVTYAGVFPEQISHVVSLDMMGPEPGTPKDAAAHIRSHVIHRRAFGPPGRPHSLYPSLERAIERRMKSARMAPGGHQYLSLEASTELVTRSTMPIYERVDGEKEERLQGYRFRHDARLMWPSLQYLTAEQIESILGRVECRVCLLAAEDGYPFQQDRIDRAVAGLEPDMYEVLPGSHHFHADPDTAGAVVDKISEFLGTSSNRAKPKAKASYETLAHYGMQ